MTKVSKKNLPRKIELLLNKIMDDVTRASEIENSGLHPILENFRYVYEKWERNGYDITVYRNHYMELKEGKLWSRSDKRDDRV